MPPVISIDASARAELLRRRDALVEQHLDLARSIARSVSAGLPRSFELDDLTSTAYVGLLRAATNYRPAEHNACPFSAYARPIIRGAVFDSIRRRHYAENTRASVSELFVTDAGQVRDAEAEIDAERQSEELRRAMDDLPARQRCVLECHYAGEMRLAEVGERLGVGKSRASQIHCEAITALREAFSGAA